MRKITMLETRKGSPDGVNVNTYEAGASYALPESLAATFVSIGAAEDAKESKPAPAPENKSEGPAPENAAEDQAPRRGRRK